MDKSLYVWVLNTARLSSDVGAARVTAANAAVKRRNFMMKKLRKGSN
jgi:hypothetical protein